MKNFLRDVGLDSEAGLKPAGIFRDAGIFDDAGLFISTISFLSDGYYFFDAQTLSAGNVTPWDGSLPDSPNDLGLIATQTTSGNQPTADGTVVIFDSNSEHYDIPSTSQAGWQIVGTSLGTFAYKVDADAITELNLLGNLGGAAYRQTGDLYGIILLPDTATAAQVEAARQLLISRGAADGVTTTSLLNAWRERADIVEFGAVDASTVIDFYATWTLCNSLQSFPLIDVTRGQRFTFSWVSCISLESFPAGMFDSWNPASISDRVFDQTWGNCTSLTPQSVENILASIAASGKYATTSGASGGTALTDPEIDISYDGTGLTAATSAAINTLIERGWRVRINGELEMPFIEENGYYFFESEDLSAGSVASWDGSVTGAASLDLVAAQATGPDQPVADGTLVSFADNTDHLDIPSTSQAGWQIVGTSLGTFAYKVDADAITELNLLGNLGNAAYRQTGDLYGIILLPDTASPAQVEAARQLLISRGAADGVTVTSFFSFWRNRADIVEFALVDTLTVTSFQAAFYRCNSLQSFPLIDISLGERFFATWTNCTSLNSFPAGMFDSWNPSLIANDVFNATWQGCTSLTPQSVENILVSIAASGKYATTSGASGGTALTDPEIDIDYDGTGLTAATSAAIETLNGRGWAVKINGEIIVPNILQLQPAAAYSLRSFDSAADPNVVNVRRSSDGATSDFTSSEVSDGTLVAFVGAGNDGYVTTWYDQSGTNHATQSTASAQPLIVDNGVLVTENGEAALDINKTPLVLASTISFNDLTWFAVTKKADNGGTDSIIFDGGNGATYGGDDINNNGNPVLRVDVIYATLGNTSASGGEVNQHLSYYNRNGSNASGGLNGEVNTEATASTITFVLSKFFNYSDASGSNTFDYVGKAQEIVVFNTDQTSNRTGIENNINNHFNIY